MPRKWLGQNFLVDGNIVRKSLELGEVQSGDVVVEVGPGLGTLTRTLLGAGTSLYAVEADRTMVYHLETTLKPRYPPPSTSSKEMRSTFRGRRCLPRRTVPSR